MVNVVKLKMLIVMGIVGVLCDYVMYRRSSSFDTRRSWEACGYAAAQSF